MVFRKHNDVYYHPNYSQDVISRYRAVDDDLYFCAEFTDSEPDETPAEGFPCEWIEPVSLPRIASLRSVFTNTRKNYQALDRTIRQADWMITRAPSIEGSMAAVLARKHGKPYVVEVVGCPWDAYWNHSLRGKLMAPVMWLLTRNLVRHAPHVIYVTEHFLQHRYPTRGDQLACSDVELTQEGHPLRTTRPIEKPVPLILGTLAAIDVKYKGQRRVIEALGYLKKQFGETSFEYRLAGRGDPEPLLRFARQCGVEEQVKHSGEIPHENVYAWLDSLDVYIQPSQVEGLPRALIEAMSRGLPACGSSVGGIPQLLDKQFLFRPGRLSVSDLVSLLPVFKSPELRYTQGARNLAKSREYCKTVLDIRRMNYLKAIRDRVAQT